MTTQLHAANAKGGLTVKAHRGDSSVLLGFNLEDHLAGFAVQRTRLDGKTGLLQTTYNFNRQT